MVMNKKGVFFTLVAILLLSTLMFSFSIYSQYRLRSKSLIIETRVITMDNFIKDLDKDINRGLYISSHRSILTLIQHITQTGEFLDNSTESFIEVIFNGTVEGNYQPLISDTTLTDWMDKMSIKAQEININLDFTLNKLEIRMDSPWAVGVDVEMGIIVEDVLGAAKWNISRNITAVVSVKGFEDPVYTINTDAKVLNVINKTPFEDFVNANNETTNLTLHNNNSYYIEWSKAPDFLMRLEGDYGESPYGIESLINLGELSDQGIELQARSVVDYVYWSNRSVTSYTIDGMPSWFRMDDEYNSDAGINHLQLYQVSGFT